MKRLFETCRVPVLLLLAVCAVYWKILLTSQYTILENPDLANLDLPWIELQVHAIRSGAIAIWSPYEWFGHTIIGQFSFVLCSPLSYLLALGPLDSNGHVQMWFVQAWIIFLRCTAALFAYWLLRDLRCSRAAAATGALLYGTAGGIGNTGWPQFLITAIWGPPLFLFLLRSLRGKAPFKSAAWAGVMLGMSWLGGHHSPAIYLTLATFGTGFVFLVLRPKGRMQAIRSLGVIFAVFVPIAALQALPVFESGRLSLRWISTGPTAWNDHVPFTEHASFALSIPDLFHLFVPGGTGLYWDPFIGLAGLTLAAIAILCAFRRIEVKVFAWLALASVLFALARNDVFYGLLYVLMPLIEKAREPIVVLGIFDIAIAALAAFGLDELLTGGAARVLPRIAKALAAFAVLTLALLPFLQGDSRVGMTALVALGISGVLLAWQNRLLTRPVVVSLLCAALMIEQGVESDWNYARTDDKTRAIFIKPLFENQDIADFLKSRPQPVRAEINRNDVSFNFGNWYRIDAPEEYANGLPADTYRLTWWSDRLSRMYGENYSVSRAATRPGQQDLFTGRSGLKVFANPAAFPRAWTVHNIQTAPDEDHAATLAREGTFDLRSTAVMTGKIPALQTCAGADQVDGFEESLLSMHVNATMACTGLIIISDSYYPGWRAQVDGKSATLWKVNTAIRGIVVPAGHHQIVMNYRPLSVYLGLALAILGFTFAIVLQRRKEPDGVDLMN